MTDKQKIQLKEILKDVEKIKKGLSRFKPKK